MTNNVAYDAYFEFKAGYSTTDASFLFYIGLLIEVLRKGNNLLFCRLSKGL